MSDDASSPAGLEMDNHHSLADVGEPSTSPTSKKKRRIDANKPKNLQACDRCRQKKIKCEPLDLGRRDVCQSCHASSIACTFEMPLTASRTKRVQRGLSLGTPIVGSSTLAASGDRDHDDGHGYRHLQSGAQTEDGESDDGASTRSPGPERQASTMSVAGSSKLRPTSVRREGPTSLSFILHSTPTLPISFLADWDGASGQSMYATPPDSGDGFILIASETDPSSISNTPPSSVLDVLQSDSWTEVVSRLVETFLVNVSPLIPVVVREDMGEAGQTLIHAMAAVAAARRNCPQQIFETLRYILRREMHEQDTLSDITRQNVQILLISCLVDELSLQAGGAQPAHIARTRLAAAIRMAQDLSMDRPIGALAEADRRIWRCAMVLDQWNAARNGVRPLLPIGPNGVITTSSEDFFPQLVAISTILGRVINEVYGAEGIKNATDDVLNRIRDALHQWKEGLPSKLRFNGLWSSLPAGILNMLYTGVRFLLYRPFMRWSFIVPPTIDMDLNITVWVDLLTCSRGSIEWAANQEELADLLFFGPYVLALGGLIQYHTWARRKEWDGVVLLDKARRDAVERWISRSPESHLPLQKAQLRIISLLCNATRLPRPETTSFAIGTRGLNPTPGSLNRLPETSIRGVTFLRDPSHPRGGVLVATQQAAREIKDLPAGTVIIGGAPVDNAMPSVSTVGAHNPAVPNPVASGPNVLSNPNIVGLGNMGVGAPNIGVNGNIVGVSAGNGVVVGPAPAPMTSGTGEEGSGEVGDTGSMTNGITPTTQGYLNALLAGEGIDTRTTLSAAEWDTMASYILPGFDGMAAGDNTTL